MMQNRLLAMTVVALAFSSAQAAESSGSEFFHQPGAGTSEVVAKLGYRSDKTTAKGATTDTKTTGIDPITVQYQYGLDEMLAVGGYLSYASYETDSGGTTKPKTSGLKDPHIFLSGTSPMGGGALSFGADLGLGFTKNKAASTTQDGNTATGGYTLAPNIGYEMPAGPGNVGGRLTYTWIGERTVDVGAGTDYKYKGGEAFELAPFYEYNMADAVLGVDLKYTSYGELKQTTPSPETVVTKTYTTLGADIYAKIPVGGFDLLPALAYTFSSTGDAFDKVNLMTISVAGRMMF